MEIMAGLVRLKNPSKVPLPWFNRPALGSKSGTTVWVSQVTSIRRKGKDIAPPDILISPLEPARLKNLRSFTIDVPERAGAIGALIKIVSKKCNIDLMETVTIDQRTKHRVTFVVQPKSSIQDDPNFDPEIFYDELRSNLREVKKSEIRSEIAMARSDLQFPFPDRKNIISLYVDISEIQGMLSDSYETLYPDYDFNRVVVSSNTESRFIRYIFPKKGSFELRVTHLDRPGAIETISTCLSDMGYNVLLSRVSKTNQKDSVASFDSETILICEPSRNLSDGVITHTQSDHVRSLILKRLKENDKFGKFSFGISFNSLTIGRPCSSMLRFKENDPCVKRVRIPFSSERHLQEISKSRRKRIFVSMRSDFKSAGYLRTIKECVFGVIEDRNMIPVDGFEDLENQTRGITPDEVWARIWSCDGSFFIAAGSKDPLWLSENQNMEWAFTHAISERISVICHTSRLRDSEFMMPRQSMIVYGELDHGGLLALRSDVDAKLGTWFGR